MSDIKCSAIACGYNKNRYCNKKSIKVEGLFSRSKLGTFCQSFKNVQDASNNLEEIAQESHDTSIVNEPQAVYVGCSANYCEYNKDNKCIKQNINIGNPNAKYRSETECDSFELK